MKLNFQMKNNIKAGPYGVGTATTSVSDPKDLKKAAEASVTHPTGELSSSLASEKLFNRIKKADVNSSHCCRGSNYKTL